MTTQEQLISELKAGWLTREQIVEITNSKSDRKARDIVSDLNLILAKQGECILSTSGHKGYHIPDPDNEKDILMMLKAEKELRKKAVSIFRRRKALDQWLARCKDKEIASLFEDLDEDYES